MCDGKYLSSSEIISALLDIPPPFPSHVIHRPDDDEDEAAMGCAKISQFFAPKSVDVSKKKHRFFEERGLKPVTNV